MFMRCRWQSQREVVTVAGLLRQVQCYYRELKQIWLWYRHKIKPAPHRVQYVDYFLFRLLRGPVVLRIDTSCWKWIDTHFFALIFCLSEKLMISCSDLKLEKYKLPQIYKLSFQIFSFPGLVVDFSYFLIAYWLLLISGSASSACFVDPDI